MSLKEWNALVTEEALEPELPIIDSHHHLWDNSPAPAYPAYSAAALMEDMTTCGHNIAATVLVDAHSNYRADGPAEFRVVGETEHGERVRLDGVKRGGKVKGICAGLVPHADLLLGKKVGEVLDAHIAASSRFRGIRHMSAFDLDLPPIYGATEPGILLRPVFREGFAELAKRKLSFDAWMFQSQLPELLDLARQFPEATIVLDHFGGPMGVGRYKERRAEGFQEWKSSMAALSRCPNIALKLGGLNMTYTARDATGKPRPHTSQEVADRQRDLFQTAIDLFSPSRCMVESNFPVDMLSISYPVLWNSFKRVTASYTPAERADMFFGTANRVYRLGLT